MKKFQGSSLFRFLLRKVDVQVASLGFSLTMAKILSDCQTKLIIKGRSEKTDSILQNQPVLVVANHAAESDVLVLAASLAPRKNIYLIINSNFMDLGEHFNKYLIPVFTDHHFFGHKNIPLFLRRKLFIFIHRVKNFSKEVSHRKNIKNIKRAAAKITKGSLVIIFPGDASKNDIWFSGIGHMIKAVNSKKKFFWVKAYIRGTSAWDYLRLIPGVSKLFPPFEVFFSTPKSLNRFNSHSPQKITGILEKEYKKWKVGGLKEFTT